MPRINRADKAVYMFYYKIANKNKLKNYDRVYYEIYKEKIAKRKRVYYEKNRESILARARAYYCINKDTISANKEYRPIADADNEDAISLVSQTRIYYCKKCGNKYVGINMLLDEKTFDIYCKSCGDIKRR